MSSLLLRGGSAFLFSSVLQLIDKTHPHLGGQSALLSLPISMLILPERLTETLRIMFDQLSRHPVTPASWHIKLPSQCLPQKGRAVTTGEGALEEMEWVTDNFHTNLVKIFDLSLDLGHAPCPSPQRDFCGAKSTWAHGASDPIFHLDHALGPLKALVQQLQDYI